MSVYDDVVAFFTGRGWSDPQARGIANNLGYESGGFNIAAVGDGGKAYGLAQWHPDRQGIFEKIFGKSIKGASLTDQLSFVDYELRNNEKAAGRALAATTTEDAATYTFMKLFERPANMSSLNSRLTYGGSPGSTGGSFLDKVKGFLDYPIYSYGEGDSLSNYDPTGISGILNGNFASRATSVIVGVILVGLAIAAFVFLSDKGQNIISKVSPIPV